MKVTFTDDAGNEETLASAATATVAARPRPGSAPDAPDPAIGTAVFVGGVDLEWNDVAGAGFLRRSVVSKMASGLTCREAALRSGSTGGGHYQ